MTSRIVFALFIIAALASRTFAQPAEGSGEVTKSALTKDCALRTSGDTTIVLRVSQRPQTRLVVDLTSENGRSVTTTFESSTDSPLSREIRLAGSDAWIASVTGERSAVPTPDGKGSVFVSYIGGADCAKGKLTASLKVLTVALDGARWTDVTQGVGANAKASEVTIEILKGSKAADISAESATTLAAVGFSGSARGLESTIPDALRETLSLLAEIAVDRAKAEGARLLKKRIKKYLCDELTIDSVLGITPDGKQRLLPSTCGQLENLRITDLGASASGFVDALRQDIVDVVVPALVAKLAGTGAFSTTTKLSASAKTMLPIVTSMIRRGVQPDTVRLALLTLLDATTIDANVKLAIQTALQCTKQECTLGDLETFLSGISADKQFWPDVTLRLIAIFRGKGNEDATKLGAELVDVMLDVVKHECAGDAKCEIVVGAFRDVSLGVIEGDYLRALGGLQAVLTSTGLAVHLHGKPLELAASVASYISTYRDTKNQDATVARELRKKALEGLIDAATDRTNREGQWIASLGASVGFTGGRQYVRSDFGAIDAEQRLQDVRLPLGVMLQRMPGLDSKIGFGWYGLLAVADLAQFVTSPALDDAGMPIEAETKWSDFVVAEIQAGLRFGNAQIPLTIGFDAYYTPRESFDVAGETKSTSVVHVGFFAGFNVPFFDIN